MASKKQRRRRDKGQGSVYPIKNRTGQIIAYYAALPIDGKVERRRAPTEQAAAALLEELRELRKQGIDVGSGAQPVSTWTQTWYDLQVEAGVKRQRTLSDTRRLLENYILPAIGKKPLDEVKPDDIQQLIFRTRDEIRAYYTERADKRAAEGLAGARHDGIRTARALASLLKQAFAFAVTRKLIPESPYRGIVLPKVAKKRLSLPTEAQIGALLHAAKGTPLEALWHVYALLGLRRGEGIGLRWADYDLSSRTIRVAQQVQALPKEDDEPSRLIIGDPKSHAGERTLPAPAALCELLDSLKLAQMKLRVRRAQTWQDNDLIFCNRDGGPLWPRYVEKHWYELRAQAGIGADITLHRLRHLVATLLDEAGATEAIKREILGHEAGTITQRYTHARLDRMRDVLERVSKCVLEAAA